MTVDKPDPTPHATAIPSVARRLVILVIGLVFAIHTFLVFVWISPVNPFRDAVGPKNVSSYINNPVFDFEQSWSVFAPTPRRGGENVRIRAFIGKPGSKNGTVTDWYDITADEDQRIKYLVNPSSIHSATRRLGGNINKAMGAYNAAQKRVVAANFVMTPRSKMVTALDQTNTHGVQGRLNNEDYVRNDEMLTRFGTMYAIARWGKGVSMVQFLVGHRTVPNFTSRNDVNFLDVPFHYNKIGWRKAIPGSADAQAAFNGYVDQAPAKSPAKKDGE
jgi:hypothetical protein